MSVTAAKGFAAAGVSAGIRPSGKPDVALVRSLVPAVGAAMWTLNRVQAAPVVVSRRHLALAEPQAVVVNAGVANAATGAAGEDDARATAAHAASLLALAPEQVVVLSTGVIGPRLPMSALRTGVDEAAAALSPGGGPAAAEAILTTDAGPKTAVAERAGFTVGGMAKGAGMIHPCLATMLAVVTTDYPLEPGEADAFLRPAVERSFNRISVDGDCSTNDAVVLLANGAGGVCARFCVGRGLRGGARVGLRRSRAPDRRRRRRRDRRAGDRGLERVVGRQRRRRSRVASRPRRSSRRRPSVATRTGVASSRPRAPRRGTAASRGSIPTRSRSRSTARPCTLSGAPTGRVPTLSGAACRIELDLGLGDGSAGYLASDLSTDYVKLNAEYTT